MTPGLSDAIQEWGPRLLEHGSVPGPPPRPWEPGTPYPLAVDVDGRLGAVSFAVLDLHPDVAPGWWCLATIWSRDQDGWTYAGGESDNTTSPTPFERPPEPENSVHGWCDWHTNGGAGHWGDEDSWRHTFVGIVPAGTARTGTTLGSFIPVDGLAESDASRDTWAFGSHPVFAALDGNRFIAALGAFCHVLD